MKQTGFGMVVSALIVIVTIAALAALGWFGFRFVQDNILDNGGEQSEEDRILRDNNIDGCVALARDSKGTGQFTYASWKRVFPFCATIVTLRIWRDL